MKRYTMVDKSDGVADSNMPLKEVLDSTDLSYEEVDNISNLQVGEVLELDSISIERTE